MKLQSRCPLGLGYNQETQLGKNLFPFSCGCCSCGIHERLLPKARKGESVSSVQLLSKWSKIMYCDHQSDTPSSLPDCTGWRSVVGPTHTQRYDHLQAGLVGCPWNLSSTWLVFSSNPHFTVEPV